MTLTSLPLIYIAGPFRGPTPLAVRRNVEAARDLGLRVAEAGGYPVIPHTMTSEFDKLLTDEFWLQGTMELLRRCDAAMFSSRWEQSSGTRAEHTEALRLGLPIFMEHIGDLGGIKPLRDWVFVWTENQKRRAEAGIVRV